MNKIGAFILALCMACALVSYCGQKPVTADDVLTALKQNGFSDAYIDLDDQYLYLEPGAEYLYFGFPIADTPDKEITIMNLEDYRKNTHFAEFFDAVLPLFDSGYQKGDGEKIYAKISEGLFDEDVFFTEQIGKICFQNIGVDKDPPYLVINPDE